MRKIPTPTEKPNPWHQNATAYKLQPKFIKLGKQVTIYPEKEPIAAEVDGKWGPRHMYIIDSNVGLIYITEMQMLEIDQLLMMRGNYTEPLVWVPQ